MPKVVGACIITDMSNNNTTTGRKVVTRKRHKLALPPRSQKPYSRKELSAEVLRLTGEELDPAYLADIANGNRINHRLDAAIKSAIANLTKAQA